jgi:butyryl-CoA dehydrogenase
MIKVLKEEIEQKLALSNVYKIYNDQVELLLSKEENDFVKDLQAFCVDYEPKIDFEKDVYVNFPALGEKGYIQRLNAWKDFKKAGCKYEMLLGMNIAMMDPELDLARLASGILCGNPTFQHGTDATLKVQDELLSGQKIGCIAMTEPNHGSDTVNMECIAGKQDDGFKLSGSKVFTTNGPKADYFIGYAVTDNQNPRGTMVQAMLSRDMGITTERITIPAVPRVHIGKTYYNDIVVPNGMVTGQPGAGFHNLFDGLVPERLSIVGSSLGICWSSIINGIIYCNMREQFGKPVMKYQAVSYPFADMLMRVSAATMAAFKIAEMYDENILQPMARGEKIQPAMSKASAAWSGQIKYLGARLAGEISYEVQQLMGGVSVTNNTRLARTWGVSSIQEVIGGSRGVMQLIVSGNLKKMMKLL